MAGAGKWTLGLRAQRGGPVFVALAGPVLLAAGVIACDDDDGPYGQARLMPEAAARTFVADVAAGQQARAEAGLAVLIDRFGRPARVALIANRATWVTDLLAHARGWADHVPVVEALAVRAATRAAILALGLPLAEPDETALAGRLAAEAGWLTDLGQGQRPWTRKEKLAALAATD
jgi:hypothetical protein